MSKNRMAVIKQRPLDVPSQDDFAVVAAPMPTPEPGQVLLETVYVSVDPYVRVAIDDRTTTLFGAAQPLDTPLMGKTISRVVESRSELFHPGEHVMALSGWQKFAVADAESLQKLDPDVAPLSWWLGVLGTTGFAAYVGTTQVAPPAAGQTYVVTSAAGATGSIAGQIAGQRGARVIGIAGAKEKCDYVVNDLGFAGCVSHHAEDLVAALAEQCPDGVDHSFENVGGKPLEAVLELIKPGGIVALCGVIGSYNQANRTPGPNLWPLVRIGASIRGFRLPDYQHVREQFIHDMLGWLNAGKIKHREEVMTGIECAGEAYNRLMTSNSAGKIVVKL
ncbi:NADP-dependent oxidoreductase [Nitratireductor aestuarii]|uniref:NADP-dependent oxidoreductase n=1 Tax=Nitratireductor aestuarii TaxID=1735103 RepID=A0A916W522_9HYPH|nr:NADP-dependent oxidoreductase [Nitratireductor aestuarii]GGA66755.1 NADP-dependent oxidoreductase [Nitratireductor aestuarii]